MTMQQILTSRRGAHSLLTSFIIKEKKKHFFIIKIIITLILLYFYLFWTFRKNLHFSKQRADTYI